MAVAFVRDPVPNAVLAPQAVLLEPVRSEPSAVSPASTPIAVLELPVVLKGSETTPSAVFPLPPVFLRSDSQPMAVLALPAVLERRAKYPSAALS
jgi:hypothetical protein